MTTTVEFSLKNGRHSESKCSFGLTPVSPLCYAKKWAIPGLFIVYCWPFQVNVTIFQTNKCEKCPPSIQC